MNIVGLCSCGMTIHSACDRIRSVHHAGLSVFRFGLEIPKGLCSVCAGGLAPDCMAAHSSTLTLGLPCSIWQGFVQGLLSMPMAICLGRIALVTLSWSVPAARP